jgi:hypothetical protein
LIDRQINRRFFAKEKMIIATMDKKVKLLVIGELGYYSLFAEGYLHFYSAQKLKIKTSAFSNLTIDKKVARILEEDIIQSKEQLISLSKAAQLNVDHLLLIGDVPDDFKLPTKKVKVHTFKVKKGRSLEEERDAIKKKMLKFLDKQGLYGDYLEDNKDASLLL